MAEIKIDVTQIPEFRREQLCLGAIRLMQSVFSEPNVEEEYQRWLAEQVAEQAEEGGETS